MDILHPVRYTSMASSGANVVATIRAAEGPGPRARVVTLMTDSDLKYTSTGVYRTR